MLHSLGRVIARRAPWFAITWLVLVAAGFASSFGLIGEQGLFDRLGSATPEVASESTTGQDLLLDAAPGPRVQLLLTDVDPKAPVVRQAVVRARVDLEGARGVAAVLDPYMPASGDADPRALIAADGRAVLVTVQMNRVLGETYDADLAHVSERLEAVAAEVPGSTGLVGGVNALIEDITEQVEIDLRTGEGIALPVSLLVMVVVFGGFIAAGLPIVGAIASIAGALASLLAFSYLIDLDASVVNVVTVLGLGLSIDYGLLLVSRFREELRLGQEGLPEAVPDKAAVSGALASTMAHAGRTVVFSAITVAISLSGLMFFRADILRAIGAAGVSVVIVALLVALTLVPALIALAGERLIRPGLRRWVPVLRRIGDVAPSEGVFSRLARRVQRRPWLVVASVLTVLGVLAWPVLSMQLTNSGVALLPKSAPQRMFFDELEARFPASLRAHVVVVTRATPAELAAYSREVAALPGVAAVDPLVQQSGPAVGDITWLGVREIGNAASSPEAKAVVAQVRALDPPFEVYVTGETAQLVDFVDDIQSRAPLAAAVVVLATFVLLFLMTGSVLIPVKALLMNIVSLGASFGVLVWVFEKGNLEGLLQFDSAGGIETTIPALVVAFGFGLSMDYEVFLLSRIKELRDAGYSNDEAVTLGLQRSGRIITSAALIIVIVFAGFVGGQLLIIKQTGVALAVAVAVDATLVRMLLVPATMTLLGEWNWWAPGPLRRLHERIGLAGG